MNESEIRAISRTNTQAIQLPRSIRQINQVVATSMPAGKMVPVTAFPLLREDALKTSMLHCKVDLMETAEVIKNGIQCRFMAYFVPFLAFERFNGGMDEFNRSYMKKAIADGSTVTPFFHSTSGWPRGSIPIMKSLGFHFEPTDTFNTAYIEAYNTVYNFRLRNRSETLYQGNKVDVLTSMALQPAFWQHEQYKYVVPDWDDLAMEGSVDLTFTNPNIALEGFMAYGADNGAWASADANTIRAKSDQTAKGGTGSVIAGEGRANSGFSVRTKADASVAAGRILDITANMASSGVKISLANIELAKRTQWYAELKAQFEGITDQYLVDLLMQGVTVPDLAWRQPILIADKTETFGIEKRWATDGANLTDAVVNGAAVCDLSIVMPRCPTGGIVMVVAEILPEQLFERARDPLLFTLDPNDLPNAMRDDLDPQKVERMSNGEIDTSHSNKNGLFGYRPMNWKWQSSNVRVGGKWFKPAPSDAFNEERMHFWTVEVANPTYNADFMIAKNFNQLPFVVTNQDVGEVSIIGTAVIEGNTQFGERLLENDNAYVEVLSAVDQSRIVKGV